MKHDGSLPCLQEHLTIPYPEPRESGIQPPIPITFILLSAPVSS
jgi:hypothetical protein